MVKVPLLWLLILIVFPEAIWATNLTGTPSASPLPIVPLCLLRCKDNHMLEMDNEWSSDFVFPLLGLLRSGDGNSVGQKAKAICQQNAEMLQCLYGCPGSVENQILQMGLQPWEAICANLRVLRTQLGCWHKNIDTITHQCAFESQQLRHSTELLTRNVSATLVEAICEHLRHLSVCLVAEYGKHCGPVSQRLVQSLLENSREVIAQMLRIKWADLPAKCQPGPLPLEALPFNNAKGNRLSPNFVSFDVFLLFLLTFLFWVFEQKYLTN